MSGDKGQAFPVEVGSVLHGISVRTYMAIHAPLPLTTNADDHSLHCNVTNRFRWADAMLAESNREPIR